MPVLNEIWVRTMQQQKSLFIVDALAVSFLKEITSKKIVAGWLKHDRFLTKYFDVIFYHETDS